MSYLTLQYTGYSNQTKEFEILSKDETIGCIRWYAPWRKYCFNPVNNTTWDSGCLGEVRIFLDELNKNHKDKK